MNTVASLLKILLLGLSLDSIEGIPHNCPGCHGHGSRIHQPHGLPVLPPLPPPGFPGTGQAPLNVQTSNLQPPNVHKNPFALPQARFVISKLWNGSDDTVSQASDKGGGQVLITLEDNPFLQSIVMYIGARFYDDPSPPQGKPGEAYFKLWEYEVVEAFFLSNQSEKYVELEFGPHGQHLVLLLDGRRNAIKHSLPLSYSAQINRTAKRWYGKAVIPLNYFPPQVDRFNAYAIHDQQNEPIYKSLYASKGAQPDFHDLPSFKKFNALPSLKNINQLSSTWQDAIKENEEKESE